MVTVTQYGAQVTCFDGTDGPCLKLRDLFLFGTLPRLELLHLWPISHMNSLVWPISGRLVRMGSLIPSFFLRRPPTRELNAQSH